MSKINYEKSGVSIHRGNESVKKIKLFVEKTFRKEVIGNFGGFNALFQLDLKCYKNPVLVSGVDGVGTKLKIAIQGNKHDSIGIDLVAMCVNDILTSGADPLFFLDYIAMGCINQDCISDLVKGMSKGCKEANMSLIGGETAELPDFYKLNEYDLSGFAIGIVDRDNIIDGKKIISGDLLFGISSSGFHSNGYSLIRNILFKENSFKLDDYINELEDYLKNILIKPTRIYYKDVQKLKQKYKIKGLAHITGGGIFDNVKRIIPQGLNLKLYDFNISKEFKWLQKIGKISDKEMFQVFNMGIGFVFIIDKKESHKIDKKFIPLGKII